MPVSSIPAADAPATGRARLPWPLPALLAWLASWGALALLAPLGAGLAWPWLLAAGVGTLLALLPRRASGWRRLFMAGGFPVSSLLLGAAGAVPAWAWLLPMALLLAAYPLRAWRDAPLFPTPAGALDGLAAVLPLADGARVLDAGCGLGHGLAALHRTWPRARIEGIEWSPALRLGAALRCPWARVRRGDMWSDPWQALDLVYLFQRPESMARAWAKAEAELPPGAWLLSLAFEVPGRPADLVLGPPGVRRVWGYRVGGAGRAGRPPAPGNHSTHRAPCR